MNDSKALLNVWVLTDNAVISNHFLPNYVTVLAYSVDFQIVSWVNFAKQETCPHSGRLELLHVIAPRSSQGNFRASFLGTQQKWCSTRPWSSFSTVFHGFRPTGKNLRHPSQLTLLLVSHLKFKFKPVSCIQRTNFSNVCQLQFLPPQWVYI